MLLMRNVCTDFHMSTQLEPEFDGTIESYNGQLT